MMNQMRPTIRIQVDPTNPGQFFACCGLLELADRLWPGSEGWFDYDRFSLSANEPDASLPELLATLHDIHLAKDEQFVVEEDENDVDNSDSETNTTSIIIESPIFLRLDWWKNNPLKTWAGSMDARKIFLAMCNAIDIQNENPLNQGRVVFDVSAPKSNDGRGKRQSKLKKREPFYFDSRRGASSRPIDVGFSLDSLKLETIAYPAVESLSFIGLQRCRPRPTDAKRVFEYSSWGIPLPVEVVPLAILGLIGNGKWYRFENAFRTDQKKHKAFTAATFIGKI